MISRNFNTNSNGRKNYSQKLYKENDAIGKKTALGLLVFLLENQPDFFENLFGKFNNIRFEIVENFSFGDIHIFVDEKKFECEVEVRSAANYEGNWLAKGIYESGLNIPLKPNIENSNGIYIALNKQEAIEYDKTSHLPMSFIMVKTDIIKTAEIVEPPTRNGVVIDMKNNPDSKYKIPHDKTYKYGYSDARYSVYN